MAARKRLVTGGVDTHKHTHHAAAQDATGRLLGDAQSPTTAAGYAALLDWLRGFGRVQAVGVEGTGSYGAGLARYLTEQQITVMEVDRPGPTASYATGGASPTRSTRSRLLGRCWPAPPPASRRRAPARSRRSAPCG
jgi:hypothetical protein